MMDADEVEIRAAADQVGQAVADLVLAALRSVKRAEADQEPTGLLPLGDREPGALTPEQEAASRAGLNVWLTTAQVARLATCHATTVTVALTQGKLHGHKVKPGGRWRVKPASVDAWLRDADSFAACGCGDLPPIRKRQSLDVSITGATARSATHHRNRGSALSDLR